MRISKFILAVASVLALGVTSADANTLIVSPVAEGYQESTNNPCIIGRGSCNAGVLLTYSQTPSGNPSSFDVTSPAYDVQLLQKYFGNEFVIGLDINQSNAPQSLTFFGMYVNGSLVDSYSNPTGLSVPPTPNGGNGNGWADYIISGFTSLAGYQPTDKVQFRAAMKNLNGGFETFFVLDILDTPTEDPDDDPDNPTETVPEPAALALLGFAMLGSAVYGRRRQ